MPFQEAPPAPKLERTIMTFKDAFMRDLIFLERRLAITTDPKINANMSQIKEIILKMKNLVEQLPT